MNFEIMKLVDIQKALSHKHLSIPSDIRKEFSDLTLKESSLLPADILSFEESMSLTLPRVFKEMILAYDFGNLRLGNVWFGKGVDYSSFLAENNVSGNLLPWWGSGKRPPQLLMVASTDGYILLLNVTSGTILAFERSDSWESCKLIASSFLMFIRAAGSVFLQKKDIKDFEAVSKLVESSVESEKATAFWREFIYDIT